MPRASCPSISSSQSFKKLLVSSWCFRVFSVRLFRSDLGQVGFVSQLQAMVTCGLDGEINICDVHTNQQGSEKFSEPEAFFRTKFVVSLHILAYLCTFLCFAWESRETLNGCQWYCYSFCHLPSTWLCLCVFVQGEKRAGTQSASTRKAVSSCSI